MPLKKIKLIVLDNIEQAIILSVLILGFSQLAQADSCSPNWIWKYSTGTNGKSLIAVKDCEDLRVREIEKGKSLAGEDLKIREKLVAAQMIKDGCEQTDSSSSYGTADYECKNGELETTIYGSVDCYQSSYPDCDWSGW